VTRTWDATTYCRLTQEITEPSSGTYKVTRSLAYDGFGNPNSESITGIGMSARTTATFWGVTGQYPHLVTNPLSQTTTFVWDLVKGVKTSEADPNSTVSNPIVTSWLYDDFGRRLTETRPDGTSTAWGYFLCTAVCDTRLRMDVLTLHKDSAGAAIRSDRDYFDSFDRPLFEYRQNLAGSQDLTTRDYDSLGRVIREYFPQVNTAPSVGYSTITYDLLNRPTQISRPISASNSTPQTTTIAYEGLTTRVTDAVQDSPANTLFSATYAYGIAAHRTQTVDMDMGTWNYVINALGEVTRQTDAKSQIVDFVYDALGRLDNRTEPEGLTDYVWGNSAASWNIGRLASVTGPGYSEIYTFDNKARLQQKRINADATNFDYHYAYSATTGLLDSLTYPLSLNPSTYRLKLKYNYQYGILNQIVDFNVPATVFWTGNAMNPRGQITQETAANGLITNRAFDAVSGFLASIQTGTTGNPTLRQNVGFLWDRVGTLTQRQDNAQGLTESFYYDNLHRLDVSA
jgi:YD repeat-containing protein